MLAIELRNIVKKYGKTVALKGSDLQIKCGEIYGLLGFNRAGKTITLKILAGLLTPDEGEAKEIPITKCLWMSEDFLISKKFTFLTEICLKMHLLITMTGEKYYV